MIATLRLKEGVVIAGNKYTNTIIAALQEAWGHFGYNTVTITAGRDGKHGAQSYHYQDRAVDVRSRDVKPEHLQPVAAYLRTLLPFFYDVVVEGDHYHIEADAKKELV